jgi:hypothetical protein
VDPQDAKKWKNRHIVDPQDAKKWKNRHLVDPQDADKFSIRRFADLLTDDLFIDHPIQFLSADNFFEDRTYLLPGNVDVKINSSLPEVENALLLKNPNIPKKTKNWLQKNIVF